MDPMSNPHQSDIYLLLGRLDGKMDALTTMHTQSSARLDSLENRVGTVEQSVASISATDQSSHNWLGYITAFGALGVSISALFIGGIL